MDKDLRDQILNLLNTVAIQAVELPPERRADFVRFAIEDLQAHYAERCPGSEIAAGLRAYADRLEAWTTTLVATIDDPGHTPG